MLTEYIHLFMNIIWQKKVSIQMENDEICIRFIESTVKFN